MSAGGTHLRAARPFRGRGGLLSLRAVSTLLDVCEDFLSVLQISSILYDVVISKPTDRAFKNMPDLDLGCAIQLSKHPRKGN